MAPLPRHVPTDDELLLRPDLDLQPVVRAASRLVPALPLLGHDALEPTRLGGREEAPPLPFDVAGEAYPGVIAEHAPEEALAVLERDLEERPPVEVQQVEGHVDERRVGHARVAADPLLQELERGRAVRIERDDLPVHDRRRRRDPGRRGEEPGEVVSGVSVRTARSLTIAWTR